MLQSFLKTTLVLLICGGFAVAAAHRSSKREYSFATGKKRFLKLETDQAAPRRATVGATYSFRFQVKPLVAYREATELPRVRVSLFTPDGDRVRTWVSAGPDGEYQFSFLAQEAGEHSFAFESNSSRWVLAQVPCFSVKVEAPLTAAR